MKIKSKSKQISLINYNLLKYQTYNFKKTFKQKFKIVTTSIEIKRALNIIYFYNIKLKKIVFIGFPFNNKITNQLKHSFISKNMLLKNYNNLTDYDLIVFNKSIYNDEKIIKNLISYNLPLIVFGSDDNDYYNINGNFKSKTIKNFCFFLLFSILKKFN